ncbi:hypothetical protein CBW16_08365 [Flavobacteriaceae bacterium JJC]|nr:hypothetical protein CBW16_08365 [Flavobacteriaceae bacterium JJC]
MWKGAPQESFEKARVLRSTATSSEKLLWDYLRNKRLGGLKFRRQHPVSLYIADFYCHELRLIIELDGDYHFSAEQQQKDIERTEILNSNGLHVVRFTNEEVQNDLNRVLQSIKNFKAKKEE